MWGATYLLRIIDSFTVDFNSHTPCGVRPVSIVSNHMEAKFQLTHPMWGATLAATIHPKRLQFQLTHPMWGATDFVLLKLSAERFQLTHPMWGATNPQHHSVAKNQISTHTPHVGCDFSFSIVTHLSSYFNSHTPCGVRP